MIRDAGMRGNGALYNAILIPIAAGVIPGLTLRPEFAGLAMALSSISVTLNALRLRRA